MDENAIGAQVVDASIKVHKALGPGMLESAYEDVLAYELEKRGLLVERQVPVNVVYEGKIFGDGYRADIVVNKLVVIELKSIETVLPIHRKQLITYLRLSGLKLGYLLNFGASMMKNGIERLVLGL